MIATAGDLTMWDFLLAVVVLGAAFAIALGTKP